MTNLFNSRPTWSPEGRNLLNASGWDDHDDLVYRPERDAAEFVPLPVRYDDPPPAPIYYASSYEERMPVFTSGEVSSATEPRTPAAPGPADQPVSGPSEEAREIARENEMEELPPFVSIGGKEDSPYRRTMDGAALREIMDIAKAQYPGADVRIGQTGRPIITMPPEATRLKVRPIGEWKNGPLERESIGGRDFQLDAPGVTLRDVANGGSQMADKITGIVGGMLGGAASGARVSGANPLAEAAGAAYGAWRGYNAAEDARQERVRRYRNQP